MKGCIARRYGRRRRAPITRGGGLAHPLKGFWSFLLMGSLNGDAVSKRGAARHRPDPGSAWRRRARPRHRRWRGDDPRRHRAGAARRRRARRRELDPARRAGAVVRALQHVPHRRRRQPARRLPHRRRRELACRTTGARRCGATARRRRRSSPARSRPAAAARRRRSGRSTAPATRPSTSTSASTSELRTQFGAQRRAVRAGVRDRARVRASRPAPDGHRPAGPRPPGRDVGCRAAGAAGRLLRRRLGRERGRDRLHRGAHPGGHRRRPRRRRGHRRRPHPGADERPGRPRELDARLLRRSARSGSRPAIARGDPARCDTFAASAL